MPLAPGARQGRHVIDAAMGAGGTFTGAPLKLAAGMYGLGHGHGAQAPDEYFIIGSANPNEAGMDGAVRSYVDLFHTIS